MNKTPAIVISVALLAAPAAWGHHNFAAHYSQDEIVEISGVVREFRFVNPHVRVYLEVAADGGETETWMAEGDASVALRRSGWTEDQLMPGDRITIVGNPARSGANMLGWESVRLADVHRYRRRRRAGGRTGPNHRRTPWPSTGANGTVK